jgi:MFS family permease
MGVVIGFVTALLFGIGVTFSSEQIEETSRPGERLKRMVFNIMPYSMVLSICVGLVFGFIVTVIFSPMIGLIFGLSLGLTFCLMISTITLIKHLALRFVLVKNKFLPQHLIPFLDHCVDLIFLRRVGGGYIFVHRLLMEHFAEMYVDTSTSKGN